MSFRDALERVRESRPEPTLVEVAVGDELFSVEVRRLDGMDWAAVMAECPPSGTGNVALGYDVTRAALLACQLHGRLLDAAGEPVDLGDKSESRKAWSDLFTAVSGTEVRAIAASWWALNMRDPNERVVALKKASAGGVKTSSS